MSKTYLLSFIFFLLSFTTQAQTPQFKVNSFKNEANNVAARVNERLDVNDNACALIQVRLAETGVSFSANTGIVGNVERKGGDYWLFVSEGTRSIKIWKDGIKTIEYQLNPIPKSHETYILEVEVIRPEPKVAIIPVTIITEPENASLSIDGKRISGQTKSHKLRQGSHNILVEMPGYESQQKTIEVNSDNVYFNFKLSEITNAKLMIESEPSVATVYLDGVKLGETPISAFYPAGTYPVKLIKEGYITIENQNLTVTNPQTRKKYILEENVGYITINTYETAQVFINGKEYTNTKDIKLFPQLLNIKVTMPKAEDVEKQIVLKRNDTINIDLYPDAATATLQIAVTPFDAEIELTGDAGEHYTAKGMKIFKDIPIGEYTIKVKAEGYRTETKTVSLTTNQVLNQNIKLKEGPSGDIEMVFVKGGTFEMGSNNGDDDEKPIHTVTVSDFYIGRYEVTQKQWFDVMGSNPSHFKGCDNCPVEEVSWNDVQEFIKKLNQQSGENYRLPTEAEWEYAARGGVEANGRSPQYAGSNNIDEVAWYWKNSGDKLLSGEWGWGKIKSNNCRTHQVGTKAPNELGIYDMSGNVWEWCNDRYDAEYYKKSKGSINPQGPSSGTTRVNRGGSWISNAVGCRVANRGGDNPDNSFNILGFRLVLVP